MRHPDLVKQVVQHVQKQRAKKNKDHALTWRQLAFIGVGSIIGAGFFLGTGLSINIAGPAVLLDYLIVGLTTFFVFGALAEMTVMDPQSGSFRTYARKAFGHAVGYICGWMYWLSGVLIISSEVTALSTFSQYWFPQVPLWIFSVVFMLTAFGINLLGVSNFGRIESTFGMIKLAALIAFVVFGCLLMFGFLKLGDVNASSALTFGDIAGQGVFNMWSALIFVFFSFGGIAVVGVASSELKDKRDVPKAGIGLIITLTTVYILSLFIVMSLVSWKQVNGSESPFVTALHAFNVPYIDSIFNLIIISAAFSTMVGALFSITTVMVSLGKDRDAPAVMAKTNDRGVATHALLLSAGALCLTIVCSFLLPHTMYEYVTTSAGVILILNWFMILSSQLKLRRNYVNQNEQDGVYDQTPIREQKPNREQDNAPFLLPGFPYTSILGMVLILLGITGALFHTNQRIGLLISVGFVSLIAVSYLFTRHYRK